MESSESQNGESQHQPDDWLHGDSHFEPWLNWPGENGGPDEISPYSRWIPELGMSVDELLARAVNNAYVDHEEAVILSDDPDKVLNAIRFAIKRAGDKPEEILKDWSLLE